VAQRLVVTGSLAGVRAGQPTPHVPPRGPQPARLHVLGHSPPAASQATLSLDLPHTVSRSLGHALRMIGVALIVEEAAGSLWTDSP
jgi:hypothetical protein